MCERLDSVLRSRYNEVCHHHHHHHDVVPSLLLLRLSSDYKREDHLPSSLICARVLLITWRKLNTSSFTPSQVLMVLVVARVPVSVHHTRH